MRAERAKLKSCKDDIILAQGKRSAALGCEPNMISSPFSSLAWRAAARQAREEKEILGWVAFTQGGGLRGLALGYYLPAPLGCSSVAPRAGESKGRDRRTEGRGQNTETGCWQCCRWWAGRFRPCCARGRAHSGGAATMRSGLQPAELAAWQHDIPLGESCHYE